MMNSKTLHVRIHRTPDDVYRFASNPENLPLWTGSFCQSVRYSDEGWVMETTSGAVGIRFLPPNEFGVLDHIVTLPGGISILNPMRVVANGEGSEVMFTLFQHPGMSDEEFARDAGMIEADLESLKVFLET